MAATTGPAGAEVAGASANEEQALAASGELAVTAASLSLTSESSAILTPLGSQISGLGWDAAQTQVAAALWDDGGDCEADPAPRRRRLMLQLVQPRGGDCVLLEMQIADQRLV